jgi:hypothetical protein
VTCGTGDAAIARDLAKARTCLHDDLVFVGLFETYRNAAARECSPK